MSVVKEALQKPNRHFNGKYVRCNMWLEKMQNESIENRISNTIGNRTWVCKKLPNS